MRPSPGEAGRSPYPFPVAQTPPTEWREAFLRTHKVPSEVRQPIAESWRRSLEYGVPLDSLDHVPCISAADLQKRVQQSGDVLRAIRQIVHCFASLYDGVPHAITYYDADGVLLLVTALSPAALKAWEPIPRPGMLFDESHVGTSAAGVTLATREPATVVGAEHLCDVWLDHHCAALPVWDRDRQLAGALAVTFRLEQSEHLFLGVLASVARCLETLKKYRLELERDYIQKTRMRVLDELASITAHELRNPLTAIRATAELGMMFSKEDNRNYELFERIVRGVDRLDDFISSLHSMGVSTSEELTPGDVREPISGVMQLLQAKLASNGIRCACSAEDDLPPVPFNDRLLRQALLNIVMNSIQAMPQGGNLRVTTRRSTHARSGENGVLIAIEDSGEGMHPEIQQKLFRTALTTKAQGTGIGLTITHQIVTKTHGGALWFSSEPGEGTTFFIFLPLQ